MIGLYVSFTPEGKIKRHLSTEKGAVPLEDTTVSSELIALIDRDFLDICVFIKEILIDTFSFGSCDKGADCLNRLLSDTYWNKNNGFPVYALLSELLIADRIRNRKNKKNVIDAIIRSLKNPISAQVLTMNVMESLYVHTPIQDLPKYPMLMQFATSAVHTLEEPVKVEYVVRSYEQYCRLLLQRFIASQPNVTKCQYCGGYFIPKTKRKMHSYRIQRSELISPKP